MRRFRLLCAVIAVAGGLAVAAGDAAAVSPVLVNCNRHDKLTEHFTVAQLRAALTAMPQYLREYTDCYQAIQDQLFSQIHVKSSKRADGSGGSGGSSFPVALVVVLGVIVLGGGALAYGAWRRGRAGPGGGGMPPPAAGA